MEINYLAVLVCGVFAMVVGGIWYGPLFGRAWMHILGVNPDDTKRQKEMQKAAGPLYLIQFILVLFQAYVLAHYIKGWNEVSGVENALWIWAAFIMPTVAGASMWNNDSRKTAWKRFLIQTGYQLVIFVVFGLILAAWK